MVPGQRDELDTEEPELAAIAAERVRAIVAAAEATAAEIVADAKAEAERIRAAARTESEQQVEAASREASGRIEQARGAVEGLVSQADRLRAQVGALGRDLAASVPGAPGREPPADQPAEPEEAPEPEEATEPEPEPGPDAKAKASGGAGEGDGDSGAPSTEELIAQLRAPSTATAPDEPAGSASPSPAAEQGAARLVAMNMALEGVPRDEIAKQLEADFGPIAGVEALLDDVLQRAGR